MSVVSSIYDLIGLISPYVLEGKRILRQLCVKGSGWDDPISVDLVARWQKWLSRLDNLGELRIPRCINLLSLSVTKLELHYFSDACFAGYGQYTYIRFTDSNLKVSCALLMAKSRVSPLKSMTVPRLELTDAVLSIKATIFLMDQMVSDF